MADKMTDKRFEQCIREKYNSLRKKAENKAIMSLSGGNMPKKAKVGAVISSPEYEPEVEKIFLEIGGGEYRNLLSNVAVMAEAGKGDKYDSLYKDYCRRHETPAEREERVRAENEKKERSEKATEVLLEYIADYDYTAGVESAYDDIDDMVDEMSEQVEEFLKSEDVLESPDRHWDYYHEDCDEKLSSLSEIMDSLVGYDGNLDVDKIEEITGVDMINSSDIIDAMIKNDPVLHRCSEEGADFDEFIQEAIDEIDMGYLHERVSERYPEERIRGILLQNPFIRKLVEQEEEKKGIEARISSAILKEMPENIIDMFPAARTMKRRFILHIGPTNSGKTHDAVEGLKNAGSGVYLGPLRLLAFEQYERLNKEGCPCNLITGEEKAVVEGATFTSSTIEVAGLDTYHEYAVIDEAQMIEDDTRGGAWTSAVLGLPCRTIAVCASPGAEDILVKLITMCGDEYTIIRHERKVPLVAEQDSFKFPGDVCEGDALIVFSKRNVHSVAAELQKKGTRCSIIYGALPYEVRHEQAAKFASGENKVVVATDAIGLGMNLPVRRVVFLETAKFDGTKRRMLKPQEIRQIAGRAGRYGMYEEGYVNSAVEKKTVRNALTLSEPQIDKAVISFPPSLIGINGPLSDIIRQWSKIMSDRLFTKCGMEEKLRLCEYVETLTSDKKLVYDLITLPFDSKNEGTYFLWVEMARGLASGYPVDVEERIPRLYKSDFTADELDYLESCHKACDLLYAYCEKFTRGEHTDAVLSRKREISGHIIKILDTQKLKGRTCRSCGKPMPWNYPYGICQKCHDAQYGYSYDDWY